MRAKKDIPPIRPVDRPINFTEEELLWIQRAWRDFGKRQKDASELFKRIRIKIREGLGQFHVLPSFSTEMTTGVMNAQQRQPRFTSNYDGSITLYNDPPIRLSSPESVEAILAGRKTVARTPAPFVVNVNYEGDLCDENVKIGYYVPDVPGSGYVLCVRRNLVVGGASQGWRRISNRLFPSYSVGEQPTFHLNIGEQRKVVVKIEILSVGLERLAQITEADALREGIVPDECSHPECAPGSCAVSTARGRYITEFWKTFKIDAGTYPWVWRTVFKKV